MTYRSDHLTIATGHMLWWSLLCALVGFAGCFLAVIKYGYPFACH
jgi:hypothetical protein